MRIISGSARGRKLFSPPDQFKSIRPTADRAREALFSIIGSRVDGSSVLDLFAGTGAFGCEALSRGASRAVFVDNSKTALDLIHRNLTLIPEGVSRAIVIRFDLGRGLTEPLLARLGDNGPFDLVFADAPYLTRLSTAVLSSLDKSLNLLKDPLIIIEERKNFEPPAKLDNLRRTDFRKYGVSSFFFYALNQK